MDFSLTEEQAMFRDSVATFAGRALGNGALARAHSDDYPWDVARQMADAGLIGITTAAGDGGAGGTLMDAVIAIQEVAAVCPRSADVVQAGNFGAIRVLAQYGSPEQKERLLKPLLAGTALIAVAMTEPSAGSAVTELKTVATPDGDGFRISGEKVFTTHGLHATVFLVYVRFGPGVGGIGSVLVERGAEGFSFGKPSRFLSGEDWNTLYFDNVHVPRENVVLGPGGFKQQIAGFNVERLGNSARALALGKHAFELAREHALNRHQFGQPLVNFQGLQWKFAEMKIKAEAAQLLLYRRRGGRRYRLPVGAGHRDRQDRVQSRRLRDGQRSDADHGRHRLQRGEPRRILLPAHPRLDDRGRHDRGPAQPRRRGSLRAAPADQARDRGVRSFGRTQSNPRNASSVPAPPHRDTPRSAPRARLPPDRARSSRGRSAAAGRPARRARSTPVPPWRDRRPGCRPIARRPLAAARPCAAYPGSAEAGRRRLVPAKAVRKPVGSIATARIPLAAISWSSTSLSAESAALEAQYSPRPA